MQISSSYFSYNGTVEIRHACEHPLLRLGMVCEHPLFRLDMHVNTHCSV